MAGTYLVSDTEVYSLLNKKGGERPNLSLLIEVMKTVSEPYVKVFFKNLNRYLRQSSAIQNSEEIFLQQRLEIIGRKVARYYLELLLKNNTEGKRISGPVAQIDMVTKQIHWYRMYDYSFAYSFAQNPELFREAVEQACENFLAVPF